MIRTVTPVLISVCMASLLVSESAANHGISYWNAASSQYPDSVCPPWTLFDSAPSAPALASGKLTISTQNNGQNQYYIQRGTELSLPVAWIIEFRCRYVSGSASVPSRAPITVQFQRSQSEWNVLCIGDSEIFILEGDMMRGQSAVVPTAGAMHTYRIQASGSAIQVYYDGSLTLTGSLVANSAAFNDQVVLWGEGTGLAYGVSEWESFMHNGSADTCVVSVGDRSSGKLSALGAIWPNPSAGKTTIPFALHHSRSVELVVFDLQGRPVATLFKGVRSAGQHIATWDGRSDRGDGLPAGLYLVRYSVAGQGAQTRRIVLVR